ncbi:MAG: ABC transporter permease subunit [Pseudonocardiaceae bacterium]|nr:ABC transporter permease subunit [Pseudonocardiaceae bacterium]
MKVLRAPLVILGGCLVGGFTILALLAPLLAPYDPRALAGSGLEPPSADHLLGTNLIGQDILSRIIWGSRSALEVGVGAATLAVVMGVLVGVSAGLLGGVVDTLAMRTVDVLLALPNLPLVVLFAALTGGNRAGLILLMGILFFPPISRIVRSQALSLRQRGFMAAAQGFGGGVLYLIRRHFVPALGPIIVAEFVAFVGNAISLEAGLAFLGLGDPTGVSWGMMMREALATSGIYFTPAWMWWVLPPGFAVTLAILGFAFLGVGLEPLMNPRSESRSMRAIQS